MIIIVVDKLIIFFSDTNKILFKKFDIFRYKVNPLRYYLFQQKYRIYSIQNYNKFYYQ